MSFSPIALDVPDHVELRRVDLAVEMQVLSFNSARNADQASSRAASTSGSRRIPLRQSHPPVHPAPVGAGSTRNGISDRAVSVLLVGVSHRTAPVPVLERVAVTDTDRPKLIDKLLASSHISEAMIVSTCNRVVGLRGGGRVPRCTHRGR